MERPIEGPDPYQRRLSSEEAGKWLGVRAELFEKLMALHLPTVRPIYMGRYKIWAWMDVAVLGYIMERAETHPAPPPATKGKRIQEIPEDEETDEE